MMYSETHNTVVGIPSKQENGGCGIPEEDREPIALLHKFTPETTG